ncbi:MAG TPA: uracil-DNA glycosylase [Terrimicrobiaceae bacterium]
MKNVLRNKLKFDSLVWLAARLSPDLCCSHSSMIHSSAASIDRPKLLADPTARRKRGEDLLAPHMVPLRDFVQSLRNEIGPGASVPDFDPWDGGTAAEILFLLEAPGAKAVFSGFISRNNPDETAKNFFELNAQAGIPRERTITWNIVPWYIGSGSRIRPANNRDVTLGASSLLRLLDLLPALRIVVLIGRKAEYAKDIISRSRPEMRILKSPHPSPLFVNNAPGNRGRILDVLREALRLLEA